MKDFQTLYLCYFGVREPLVQTQVLPYLREIAKEGLKIKLLTFEPHFRQTWTSGQLVAEREKLAAEGIEWHFLKYHKRPSAPATLFDVLCGAFYTRRLMKRERIDIIHARVHVPALMGALAKKFFFGKKPALIFDIRGFFPEEYTDAGVWPENGLLYRAVKRIEKWLLKEADGFVVLTEKARGILFSESAETGFDKTGRPVEVIPCCVDLKRFEGVGEALRNESRRRLNIENRKVIAYVGSFGGWYLGEEMFDFFAAARQRDAGVFVLILTQREKEKVAEKLRSKGFGEQDFLVESVAPAEIPEYLSAADVTLSFIKRCYSKQASSPTKIAEYLACGVPVISNRGIGDLDELIETDGIGVLVDDFSRESYLKALDEIEILQGAGDLAEKCRRSARQRFDLSAVGGTKYRLLYGRLLPEND